MGKEHKSPRNEEPKKRELDFPRKRAQHRNTKYGSTVSQKSYGVRIKLVRIVDISLINFYYWIKTFSRLSESCPFAMPSTIEYNSFTFILITRKCRVQLIPRSKLLCYVMLCPSNDFFEDARCYACLSRRVACFSEPQKSTLSHLGFIVLSMQKLQ